MMTAVSMLAVLLAASMQPAQPDVGPRISAALSAAQTLQGPLDGAWLLRDAAGRPLYRFEIVDPADERGPLTGAWRDARGAGAGFIATMRRGGHSLQLEFSVDGEAATRLRLIERSPGVWTGQMTENGADLPNGQVRWSDSVSGLKNAAKPGNRGRPDSRNKRIEKVQS